MPSNSLPQLPDSSCGTGPGSVPVFNCVVILSPLEDGWKTRGRVANLACISAEGNSERDVLMQLAKRFKTVVMEHNRNQESVPWIDPPEVPTAGERQRFIPVHL